MNQASPNIRALQNKLLRNERHPAALPYYESDLLGRNAEIADILKLFEQHRCVVLTGAGGSGKTRLLQHLAAEMFAYFDGTLFVSFAAVIDADLVMTTLAQRLGIRERAGTNLFQQIITELQGQRLFLLFDNVEHVRDAAGEVFEAIRQRCPHLKMLLTSRVPIPSLQAVEYKVHPLALPPQTSDAGQLYQNPAVALFLERSELTDIAQDALYMVANICRVLGGMPLAIELAAAQASLQSIPAMYKQIEAALAIIESPETDVQHPHVRIAVSWIYGLLGVREKELFLRLAAFDGAFSQAEVASICRSPLYDPEYNTTAIAVIDDIQLDALVGAKLIRQTEGSPSLYIMPDPLHDLAIEWLLESGHDDNARERHAIFYIDLVQIAYERLRGPESSQYLEQLERAHTNIRATLRWVLRQPDGDRAARFAAQLARFWYMHGHFTEGRGWLELVLARTSIEPRHTAKILNAVGTLTYAQGEYEDAKNYLQRCLDIYHTLDDVEGIAGACNNLGMIATIQGNYREATRYYQECIDKARTLGNKAGLADTLSNLGVIAFLQGNFAHANALFAESLIICEEIQYLRGSSVALLHLGKSALQSNQAPSAATFFRRSLTIADQMGETTLVTENIEQLAATKGIAGQWKRAAHLWGHAAAFRIMIGSPTQPEDRKLNDQRIEGIKARVSNDQWAYEWQIGQDATRESIIAESLSL